MSDLTTVTTNLLPVAQEGYSDNLSASISSLAAVVPVNSASAYDDGDVVVLVVEPGTTNEAVFTGIKASSPDRFTSVKWTEGNTGVGHASGATVVDYVSATHFNMLSKNIRTHANQDGSLKETAVRSALALGASSLNGWTPLAYTPSTVAYDGNRSYTLTFAGQDITGTVSNGMRLRITRTVAAPTQCASLNGTNQYFSKSSPSGMTFTDDFVVSAWVKLNSYTTGAIVSRFNNTNGWICNINSNGTVNLTGFNGNVVNSRAITSYQSLPLNRWVHVTAQLDMSAHSASPTTSYIMFDGIDVPAYVTQSGTNPSALVQGGDLHIGAQNGSNFWPGKIAQVVIYPAKMTQATIRGYMTRGMTAADAGFASAYSLSNSLTDINATNANNLTANGGAVATNADSPFGLDDSGTPSSTLDFGIIQRKSFSTNTTLTVQVPEGCTIPTSGGVTAVAYATEKVPYGFPSDTLRWAVGAYYKEDRNYGIGSSATYYNAFPGLALTMPVGKWLLKANVPSLIASGTTVATINARVSLTKEVVNPLASFTNTNYFIPETSMRTGGNANSFEWNFHYSAESLQDITSTTEVRMAARTESAGGSYYIRHIGSTLDGGSTSSLQIINAYL